MGIFKKIAVVCSAAVMAVSMVAFTASAEEAEETESAISEYSVFETIKIRRDLMNEAIDIYSKSDYDQISKYLVNNSMLNIRYFTLSYDTEDCDLSAYMDPTILEPQEVIYKSKVKIVVANLAKEGYVNSGWEYNGETYVGDQLFEMPANDVVLKPLWHKRCQITYNAGDYEGITGNSVKYVMSAEKAQFFLANSTYLSRPGYQISGWLSSYDGQIYKPSQSFIVPPSDITFEAIWSPATYDVSISANNGNSTDKITLPATYTENFIFPECEFENGTKTFAGWKYNGKIYQPGESFEVPALVSGQRIVVVATWK